MKRKQKNEPTREPKGRTARRYEVPSSVPDFRRYLFPIGEGCYQRLTRPGAE